MKNDNDETADANETDDGNEKDAKAAADAKETDREDEDEADDEDDNDADGADDEADDADHARHVIEAQRANATHSAGLRKLFIGAALLGVGLFAVNVANEKTRGLTPLDAIPAGAFIVATADVTALRRSPIYDTVFSGAGPSRSLGLGSVEAACGFDPVTRVRNLAFVVPEEGDRGEFGLAATVDVSPDEIKACASALSQGRKDGSDSALKKDGEFWVMEGRGASSPRLAYRPQSETRGLLLVGKGTMVDAMMETEEGKRPRFIASAQHAKLRAALMKSPLPTVVVTSVLPESTRARIRNEMQGEVASVESREMMSGVLAVDTAGAALLAGDANGVAELRIELTCEQPDACAKVKALIEKKKLELQQNFLLRLVAAPLFDAFVIEQDGKRVTARTSAPAAEVAKMLDQALNFSKRGAGDPGGDHGDREPPHRPRLGPPGIRPPDEVLRAPGQPASVPTRSNKDGR